MSVLSRRRFFIPLSNGNTINVLVEEQVNSRLYKYAAVLNDWDEGCMFETGGTIQEAVSNLADLINVSLPDDWQNPHVSRVSVSVLHGEEPALTQ